MNNELTCVVVSYSFDPEVNVHVFGSYQAACDFIKKDFEREKLIDLMENGYKIDEQETILEEDRAVLATKYIMDGTQTTTWTIANVYDKR